MLFDQRLGFLELGVGGPREDGVGLQLGAQAQQLGAHISGEELGAQRDEQQQRGKNGIADLAGEIENFSNGWQWRPTSSG